MSHTAVFTLFGIHSTKYELFLFCTLSICSSTSFIDILPRNTAATLRHGKRRVLLHGPRRERRETWHEEVQTRERHHVHRELPQIGIQLTGKPGRNSGHGEGDQMIEITVARVGNLQRAEADIVQSLVIDAISLVGVLHQLVHR
ncbi:hypothetical protein X777_02592 [Ooceraea biroi]|uniref:Uncharacterized protein n=1 Tax=Ooceraea biroi TaxID=2015173 RepID=A0A026WNT6_OOCBI|nr:hypothetical protein X777_02592 [Ooceraea biroi]